MPFNFDQIIERAGTGAVKYDARKNYFGTDQVTPLWVADMDFAIPPCVTDALHARLNHPVLGYSLYPDSLFQSLIQWFENNHAWTVEKDWVLMAPGVVPSLFAAVQAFTHAGDGVIVQPPVYFPFFNAVTSTGRKLLLNPLKETNGFYEMDFEHLESCAKQGAKLLILCSPHNPVGRVWRKDELEKLLLICRQYKIIILSDEIHCDLTYSGVKHYVLDTLATPEDAILTAVAPNKTFNIPGLGLSALVSRHAHLRDAMRAAFETLHVSNTNPFSIVAFEAAYRDGLEWRNALMAYLEQTRDLAVDFINNQIPNTRCLSPESTCLLWLDCRDWELSNQELKQFFIKEAGLGLNPGVVFGENGSGHMRLNIGASRAVITQALDQLRIARIKTLQINQ